jgi:hypothetical protein
MEQFKTYDQLQQSTHSESLPIFERLYPIEFKEIKNAISQKILVDIGGGKADFVRDFAKDAEASKYINIDMRPQGKENDSYSEYIDGKAEEILTDKRFFQKSNFFVSGLDEASYEGDPENLAFLVTQNVPYDGVVVCINSQPFSRYFDNSSFKKLVDSAGFVVYKKIK